MEDGALDEYHKYKTTTTTSKYGTVTLEIILHTHPPTNMEQSVPKCRHIKFRRRKITQKKAYNITNHFLNTLIRTHQSIVYEVWSRGRNLGPHSITNVKLWLKSDMRIWAAPFWIQRTLRV